MAAVKQSYEKYLTYTKQTDYRKTLTLREYFSTYKETTSSEGLTKNERKNIPRLIAYQGRYQFEKSVYQGAVETLKANDVLPEDYKLNSKILRSKDFKNEVLYVTPDGVKVTIANAMSDEYQKNKASKTSDEWSAYFGRVYFGSE